MILYSLKHIKECIFILLFIQKVDGAAGIRSGACGNIGHSSNCNLNKKAIHAAFQIVQKPPSSRRCGGHIATPYTFLNNNRCVSFDNNQLTKSYHKKMTLWSKISDDDMGDSSSSSGDNNKDGGKGDKKRSTARAGGRTSNNRKLQSSVPLQESSSPSNNTVMGWAKKVVPLLVLLSILKGIFGFLFGFGGSNSNVIYYQSTVYESRTYDADGKMERVRKESIKSNMPSSMINGNKKEGYRERDGTSRSSGTSLFLDQNFDEELDKELENSFRKNMMIINEFDVF